MTKLTYKRNNFSNLHISNNAVHFCRTLSTSSTYNGKFSERNITNPLDWKYVENHRQFFNSLGSKLGISSFDDWYKKLSVDTITQHGGSGVLKHYNRSPIAALTTIYPEHNWIIWNFKSVPQGFWKSSVNQRNFFDDLAVKLGIKTLDGWYEKLSRKVVLENGGSGVIELFNGSPTAALMKIYPEHNWIPWKFATVPQGYWNKKEHQTLFFDDLGKKIGINTLNDWYEKLSYKAIVDHGGHGLIRKQSATGAVMAAYPEHNWVPWKFNIVEDGYWNSKQNVSKFLAELSEELAVQTLDDWYRVDYVQLKKLGASRILFKYKGLFGLLKEVYPNHPWDMKRFQQKGKKAQRWLAVVLKKMFPDEEILEDYNHPKVLLPSSNRPMQLDVFIPSKNLAFEYQGQQHYEDIKIFTPSRTYQQRDEEKRSLCASNNIKLIEIPYWWNRTQEEVLAMINK